MNKNTIHYKGIVQKRDSSGNLVFLHLYRFWISDSGYQSYPRVYSALGPDQMILRGQGLIIKGTDEAEYLKQMMDRWHPDADTPELLAIEHHESD